MDAREDQQRRRDDDQENRVERDATRREPAATPRPDPKAFRQQLDAILRQRDPVALRAFLVAQGQWEPDTATDPERAMWMMIAASPALASMRGEAEQWLTSHGHTEEARTILGQGQGNRGGQRHERIPGGGTKRGGPRREGGSGGAGKPHPPHD